MKGNFCCFCWFLAWHLLGEISKILMGFVCFSRAAPEGAHHLCGSLDAALDLLSTNPFMNTIENIFIIGGAAVYTVSFTVMEHQVPVRRQLYLLNSQFLACGVFSGIPQSPNLPPSVLDSHHEGLPLWHVLPRIWWQYLQTSQVRDKVRSNTFKKIERDWGLKQLQTISSRSFNIFR